MTDSALDYFINETGRMQNDYRNSNISKKELKEQLQLAYAQAKAIEKQISDATFKAGIESITNPKN